MPTDTSRCQSMSFKESIGVEWCRLISIGVGLSVFELLDFAPAANYTTGSGGGCCHCGLNPFLAAPVLLGKTEKPLIKFWQEIRDEL